MGGQKVAEGKQRLISPSEERVEAPAAYATSRERLGFQKRREDIAILALTYSVLFSRYAIATFLSAFFPDYAEDAGISGTMTGLIFAAYPFGITITSVLGTSWMQQLGLRWCVLIGMLNTTLFTFLFGATPAMSNYIGMPMNQQQWFFLIFYFLGGLGGAVAETGCIMIANYRFRESSGTISASIGTVCGLGCMAGPPLGGLFYDIGGATGLTAFFFPFLIFAAVPFLITAALPFVMTDVMAEAGMAPEEEINIERPGIEESAPFRDVLTKSRLLALFAMGVNGSLVSSLDPTLEYRLDSDPINYSSSLVGLVFMSSSLSYTLSSIPCGYLVDRHRGNSDLCKNVQATGLFTLFLTFALLGPIAVEGLVSLFNNVPSVWIAMVLKGIGSAGANAAYPDLIIGVRDKDTKTHATISGIWNATYAIGWALGPLYGGALYETLGFKGYATLNAVIALTASVLMFVSATPAVSRCIHNKAHQSGGFRVLAVNASGQEEEDSPQCYSPHDNSFNEGFDAEAGTSVTESVRH
mmetsp:Transcript_18818/g.26222  ORF Transcript_18818/g.26222 Transcript_18818/m.26222 type:complete len:526 (-) Transcript_18818:100-1677(-)|eukprot:CAMPEP_0184493350 /NCGR_PEP_ID=MMETSP0113_2-20130426/25777_1 /TAXON_ID=91329 /ORGANISM="Norrisiella sphaerica, Strain BC52" /LENGTH=525 /DNA_ID=CAMNT_0026878579 /DNA_START=200 /DNA_END=1777 /DNA_ORIENTATION=-